MALIGVTGGSFGSPVTSTNNIKGGPVKRYDVVINGVATTLLLSDADAAARGLVPASDPAPVAKAKAPANKSRTPRNKQA